MVHEQVGNRAIPMVSVAGTLAIMAILMLTRSVDGREPLSPGEEGRKIYNLICTACHDPDPTVDRLGRSYGPPIAGSSLELLKSRVLTTAYPEGYTPKRDTSFMSAIPLTGTQLEALHTFLEHAAETAVHGG